MMGALPAYMDCNEKEKRYGRTYSLWGAKTQREPYHVYLLSIACLIESRLGEKAFKIFIQLDWNKGICQKFERIPVFGNGIGRTMRYCEYEG